MFTNIGLRAVLRSSAGVLRESSALCSAGSAKPWTCSSALLSGPTFGRVAGSFGILPPVRHYARVAKTKEKGFKSQLSDLPPAMLKMDYEAVPLAQTHVVDCSSRHERCASPAAQDISRRRVTTFFQGQAKSISRDESRYKTDDIVKRLLSLELASHSEKLKLKTEQLIKKVQRDENDRSSVEVQVAILTARIRNYQEHLLKHRKDKANKRRMLMAIDRRKKLLKNLRLVRFDAFERVCEQLGITYSFPPEYYRRATHRWLAKKEFCIKVFKAVQKQKAEQRLKLKQSLDTTETKEAKEAAVKAL